MKEVLVSVVLKVQNEDLVPDLMCEVMDRISDGYTSGSFNSSESAVDFVKDVTEN